MRVEGSRMEKTLAPKKSRFIQLLKKVGGVRISSFTKKCAAFLGLYIFFILLNQLDGFKAQLWLYLCLITAVVGWLVSYIAKWYHKKTDGQTNRRAQASSVSSVLTRLKRSIFRNKESPLISPWNSMRQESSLRDGLREHEEKAPIFRPLWDGIDSTKTGEMESRPSAAPRVCNPYSRLDSDKESSVSSAFRSFGHPLDFKVDRDPPLLTSFRDISPSASAVRLNTPTSTPNIPALSTNWQFSKQHGDLSPFEQKCVRIYPSPYRVSGFSDERENGNFQDRLSINGKDEMTLTCEKSDQCSITMPSIDKSTSPTPSIISSNGHGSRLARLEPISGNKMEMFSFPRKRSQSLRRLGYFFCCGGKHQIQLP